MLFRSSLFITQPTLSQTIKKLEGRFVIVVANLAPRKMKFGVSEGMILSAGTGGGDLFLLSADSGVTAGMQVK